MKPVRFINIIADGVQQMVAISRYAVKQLQILPMQIHFTAIGKVYYLVWVVPQAIVSGWNSQP